MPDGAILTLNAGSSTLKYRLFGSAGSSPDGTVEHIGEPAGPADHVAALQRVLRECSPMPAVAAVGHRVVHGGLAMREPVRIDADVEAVIDRMSPFAPTHNPPALSVIRAVRRHLPDVAQVAVFDTAFHATIPNRAHAYAIDGRIAERYGIRRFGFHGVAVDHVVDDTAKLLGVRRTDLNLIALHLGNGASATAVEGGYSVDTSMGMTPLEGLVMGTRSGDLDPSITFYLLRQGLSPSEVEDLYEHRSGLRGLSGVNDMRTVIDAAGRGDPGATLALDVYCHRLRKYVGAYFAVLGRVDAIVFSGGVGENAGSVRARTLAGLEALGVELDTRANAAGSGARVVSTAAGRVRVCVVPADEETAIARATARVLGLQPRVDL